MTEGKDEDRQSVLAQGRGIFSLAAGLLITINLAAAAARFSSTGNPLGFGRVALIVILLSFVWRGATWARVVVTALLFIGAALSFFGAAGTHEEALRLIMIGIGGIDLAVAGALIWSKPLRAFLDAQAIARSSGPSEE
jgi:hypothetical protein